ncbi:MAG: septation regulator SpoVG [Clostridia bacterium]|jgi:stage V sporulation protein G|nr:septation regulator SpoVG [Clostridia bacterium]
MKISDVRIRLVNKDDNKLKAVASITIDECFVVHDIKIIEAADGAFIAMPSRKTNDGDYKDIAHPLNTETRELLKNAILTAYYDELKK